MNLLPKRCILAVAAVVDVAIHARPSPVAAKSLAARHQLPPRHLESLLQCLVRAEILKGVRGPRGGYELARERRRISAGEIVRAVLQYDLSDDQARAPESDLARLVVNPIAEEASDTMLAFLDGICVEDLCQQASKIVEPTEAPVSPDFTI